MNIRTDKGALYKPLTEDQVVLIHASALEILSDVGISYESNQIELINRLRHAGAEIDEKTLRIKFSQSLVADALSNAPESVFLYSRDGKNDLNLAGDNVYVGNGGTTTNVLDHRTGAYRASSLDDIFHIAQLTEHLKNVDLFIRPCTPLELKEDSYDINIAYAGLKGTNKHVMMGIFDRNRFADVIHLASIVAGGTEALRKRPIISFYTSFSISPLQQSGNSTQILCEAAENGLPISISGVPMAGSSGPVTMAGNLTLTHAEVMAGITISQLLYPGTPVLYGGFPVRADMQTGLFLVGAIECAMMNAAIHQLARYIKIPNCSSCGMSESKIPDAQASWESAMLILTAAMGGSNLIRHAGGGMLESDMVLSFEQMIMNDEMIGMARRLLRGIEVDEEHIALNLIKAVGPGGTFMTSTHTLNHMRSEYFYGNGVTDRQQREQWLQGGAKDARRRAKEIVEKILRQAQPSCIPEDIDQRIRKKFHVALARR